MPVFQGLVGEEQLNALVAYIKSLSAAPSGPAGQTASGPAGTKSQNVKE